MAESSVANWNPVAVDAAPAAGGAEGVHRAGAPTSAVARRVERAAAVHPAMANAGFTWNTASLRQYLTDAQAKVKGSCPKPRHCRPSRSD